MQSTAGLTVIGVFCTGLGAVIVCYFFIPGAILLLIGLVLIGASIWMKMSG